MTTPGDTILGGDDPVSALRRAYRAIGLGVGEAMLRLFGQGDGRRPVWSVVDAVTGHILCRPRGMRSFDLCRVPFAHVWTLRDGQAVRVRSYLDGIELRREAA